MGNIISNMFFPRIESDPEFTRRLHLHLRILASIVLLGLLFGVETVFAQAGPSASGLCTFAGYLKQLAIVAAIIALVLLVINSFFTKSSLIGDVIVTVIIGCVIMAAAPQIISLTGLTTNCSI